MINEAVNLEFDFGQMFASTRKKKKLHIFKLTKKQEFKLLLAGLSVEKLERIVLESIPGAINLKICFSDDEAIKWVNNRYYNKYKKSYPPSDSGIQGLFDWWQSYAKEQFMRPAMSGLYYTYDMCRRQGKPFVMPKGMAKDNRAHKVY